MTRFRSTLSLFLLCLLLASPSARAASLIRDAESEHTLRMMASPIFKSAGIPPESVKIFILNDNSINAFVAGGLNMFIHTGLILNAQTPAMLLGVMAHETGHIAGAHLSQLSSATEQASMGALISTIVGMAATIGGAGQAGGAILSAGQNTALRSLLSHYRGNEQQADQAGISYMQANSFPARGMLQMFEVLRRNEQQHVGAPDPYLMTHPLTSDRIATMRSAVQSSDGAHAHVPDTIIRWHARMVAKLYAFLEQPEKTLQHYQTPSASAPHYEKEAAHLARAVAFFRKLDMDQALKEADALITLSPDGFAYDLKGQLLFETGQVDAAIAAYEKASQLADRNALILTDLAKCYLAKESDVLLPKAVAALEEAALSDDSNASTYHFLAVAYGKQGNTGLAWLAQAHESALENNPQETITYAERARDALPVASPSRLQAEDLLQEAKRLLKKKKESNLSPF